jgi:signal transduction histidine kinase/HD-like signal output (HDOD) protein
MEGLETFPAAAGGFLRLTLAPGADSLAAPNALEKLATFVASDPAIAATVLAAANRTHLASAATVQQAIATLGREGLGAVAMSMGVFPPGAAGGKDAFDRLEFWRHCLAVAAGCRIIVQRLGLPAEPEQAWLCGLLHDLGKLALDRCLPRSFRRAIEAAQSHQGILAEYEQHIIGADHCLVGHRLAELWRLPRAVAEAIWLHRQPAGTIPASAASTEIIAAVSLADALAKHKHLGSAGKYASLPSLQERAKAMGLLPEELEEIAAKMTREVDRHFKLLRLDRAWDLRPYLRAMRTAGAELARANDRLRRETVALGGQADAFRRLGEFTAQLNGQAGVGEVLEGIAVLLAAVTGQRPVVAYSLGQEGEAILAVRFDGAGLPAWRTLQPKETIETISPGGPAPAAGAMANLLADPHELDEWLDLASYAHQPLGCAGRAVGGVLYPSAQAAQEAGPQPSESQEAICGAVALALAIVQGRQRATLLGEQLAQASTILAETHLALAEARTLAAIGEMAAGAAHEMNSPLAVICGRAQLMRDKAADEDQRKTWATIAEQAQRISDIITEMMDFASPPEPAPSAIDAKELLQSAAAAFRSGDHPKASSALVDIEVGEGTPAMWADRGQTEDVLLEVMANAANAAEGNVRLRLAAEADDINSAVLLTVTDEGPGMDQQTAEAAFTPFFSLQPAGRRRGLGLPRARRYVENNAGRMWLRTRRGAGTCVYIQLPQRQG